MVSGGTPGFRHTLLELTLDAVVPVCRPDMQSFLTLDGPDSPWNPSVTVVEDQVGAAADQGDDSVSCGPVRGHVLTGHSF